MKERETSRLRATATIAQELYESARSGKPVTASAIKGFVNAWLFPRALIVLGSILTGLVLVAQTYIIYQQTRLLELQARAAQIEQEASVRERMAPLRMLATQWGVLDATYRDEVFEDCDEKCKSAVLLFPPPVGALALTPKVPTEIQGLYAFASRVQGMNRHVLHELGRTPLGAPAEARQSSVAALAATSANRCGIDPQKASGSIDILKSFDESTRAIVDAIEGPVRSVPMQKIDLREAQDVLDRIGSATTSAPLQNVGSMYEMLRVARAAALKAIEPIRKACDDRLQAEERALALMLSR